MKTITSETQTPAKKQSKSIDKAIPKKTSSKKNGLLNNYCYSKKKYKCKICSAIFASGASLGGHTSTVHPGMSSTYSARQEIRSARELKR
jgi:hypothetical protein